MGFHQAIVSITQKVGGWLEDAVLLTPNLVAAAMVICAFWLAARLGRTLVRAGLRRVTGSLEASQLLSGFAYGALFACGIIIALGIVHLEKTVTSLMTGVGILGLTLGFALQDIASNMVAGVLIQTRQPFRVGDVIETNDFLGRVDRITLRATQMTKLDGQFVLIPNKDIFNKPVINNSAIRERRVDLEMPIPADRDLRQARAEAHDCLARIGGRSGNRDIDLFFKAADGAIILLARFWIESGDEQDYLRAKSEAIESVTRSFRGSSNSDARPASQRAS